MERERHRIEVAKWSQRVEDEFPDDRLKDLSAAVYAFSELGMFGDFSIDGPTALEIWAVVEKVRREGFPDELRM